MRGRSNIVKYRILIFNRILDLFRIYLYQLPHPRNEQTASHFRWDGTVLHPIDVSMFWVGYFRAVWPYLFRVVFIRHAHHVPVTASHLHSCAP